MTTVAKTVLFLASYAPLGVLLAVKTSAQDLRWSIGFAAVTLAVLIATGILYLVVRRDSIEDLTVHEAEPQKEALSGYLIGYVLPFVVLDVHDSSSVVVTALFFIMLAILYVREELLYLNIGIGLVGRHIWVVRARGTDEGHEAPLRRFVLITKAQKVATGDRFATRRLTHEIRIANPLGAQRG